MSVPTTATIIESCALLNLPPEILTSIFGVLAVHAPTTLFSAQRVCRKFQEVINSTPIGYKLYTTPLHLPTWTVDRTVNPLLASKFPLFFDLSLNLDFAWNHNVGSSGDPYEFHNPESVNFCPPWSPDSSVRSRWHRPEASWRRLMLTHYPITHMVLASIRKTIIAGEWVEFWEINLKETEFGHLTMGTYYDILMTFCRKSFHEFGGFTLFLHKTGDASTARWPETTLEPDFDVGERAYLESKLVDAPEQCVLMNCGWLSDREIDAATYGKPVKEYVPEPIVRDSVPTPKYLEHGDVGIAWDMVHNPDREA